ncbi:hypothetical protein ACUXPF_000586, partial [Sphingomonas sanguinis]
TCRPIMSVIPCRLPRVNHASIAVASTRFSTVSIDCEMHRAIPLGLQLDEQTP